MAIGEDIAANQFSNLGGGQQDFANTELKNETSDTGEHLDFSGVDSPFDNYNGFNIPEIQKDVPQQLGDNPSTKNEAGTPVTTTQTTINPGSTMSDTDALASYNKDIARNKAYSTNIGKKFVEARNPALAYGNYEFDQYVSNVDRYRGYGKETFNKLGFNPLEDNEAYYNANTSGWQDFKRMTGQWGVLFGSSFMSNYHAAENFFKGNVGLMDPDVESAREFEKAMALGSSTKGGFTGAATNFTLNTAYAVGIAANVIAEETAIWLVGAITAPLTEGGSLVVAAAESAVVAAEAINNLRKLKMMYSAAFRGKEIGQMTKGGIGVLKALGKAEDAKSFWAAAKVGAKEFGEGAIGFVNPFRQGTEAIQGIRSNMGVYRNLNNFAKASKTFGSFYRDIRENMFAVGESQLEGGSTFNDIVKEGIKSWQEKNNKPGVMPPEDELNTIYKNAEAGGRLDTIINLPMIFLSNRVVFDGLFNFKGIKALTDLSETAFAKGAGKDIVFDFAGKTYKEAAKGAFEKFGTSMKVFRNPRVYAGAFLDYTKRNFMEGIQESLQDITSGSIKNYYTSLYDNPSQGGNHLIKSSVYKSLGEDFLSMKGLETFLSGFLMGGAMSMAGSPLKTLGVSSKEYLWSKVRPESYKKYSDQKQLMKTQAIEALNAVIADPEKFFSRRNESMTNQIAANNNMVAAKLNNDDKTFYDAKDDKTYDHVFTALDNGTYDKLISGLKDLQSLSEEDLADYFKLETGSKAKEKLIEYIGRAEQIKQRYNTIQEKFPNPFNPARFNKNTDLRVQEFIAHKAFEDAKKTAIASEYGFERSVERMTSTFNDLSRNPPLFTAAASDFTILQNENSLKKEVKLLKSEIQTLDQGGPDEKRLAKQKQAKYDAMVEYLEHLKNYNKEKENPITDENGKVTIPYNEQLLNPLKDAFHKYVKVIGKMNNEVNLFDEKINNAFNKIVDYYSLSEDAKHYNEVINHLSDPANLLRYAASAQQTLSDIRNNREEILSNAIDKYISVHELNNLMEGLGKLMVVINPDEVEALYKTGKLPSSFFDLRTNRIIDRKDARYNDFISFVENYSKLVRNAPEEETETPEEFQPEKTEEEKQAEAAAVAEEEARKKAEEEAAKASVKGTAMDAELEDRLRKAYEMYLVTGSSNVTFEEYIKDYASAQRVKEEYEREKAGGKLAAAPAAPAGPPVKTEAEITTEKAQALVDKITSLKDLPNAKLSDSKDSTLSILEMIASGNLKSVDVLNMIETKRTELAKNLTVDDLEKGDFITFVNGSQAWVTSVTRTGSIQLKMVGSEKGKYEIMDIKDIAKNINTLEENKKVSTEPVEEVVVSPESEEAIVASRDVMSEFVSNVAELQKINEENEKNVGTDNSANENDLLNNLGCNTKPA